MQLTRKKFAEVPYLSDRDIAYQSEDDRLQPFIKYPAKLDAFEKIIADKSKQDIDRPLLHSVWNDHYKSITLREKQQEHLDSLKEENTFCVTTAHQANLLMGPLYTIYKCISCIRLAEKLQKTYSEYHFIPVYVLGGEDHDFEEISRFRLFRKTVEWDREASGPTGRMDTKGLQKVLHTVEEILGSSDRTAEIMQFLRRDLDESETYGEFAFRLVNELFGKKGLLVLNMDESRLKKKFIPVMEDDLLHQSSHELIEKTIQQLQEAGFDAQANPREINLFYLGEGRRDRIVKEGEKFQIYDRDLEFTRDELLDELHQYPEKFSPNVVLRPIYQELILPNLAYIGGGGELAYWMERKEQFAHYQVNFPMLVRRDSVLWIDKGNMKRMEKLDLSLDDLFKDIHQVLKEHAKEQSDIEINLDAEARQIKDIFENLIEKSVQIDKTLSKSVAAEQQKALNSLDVIEKKMIRAEKHNHEQTMNQIRNLFDKLFPEGGLQERYDNYLAYYLRYGSRFFDVLYKHLDPMDKTFKILHEEVT